MRLAEAMADDVDLVVAMPTRSRAAVSLVDAGIDVRDMPDLLGSRLVSWLARLIRDESVDVVHTQTLAAAVPGGMAARLAGVPSVWHVREIVGNSLPGRSIAATSPATLRRLSSTLPSIVMASSATALAAIPGARFGRVVADPVPDLGWPTRDPRTPVRTVGIVGRLAHQHGQDLFVEAFARAFAKDEGVTALVVGREASPNSAYLHRLRSAARAWQVGSRVTFAGRVPDMPATLQRMDMLVHASRPPGSFRAVVVEGMQAGIPVVVTAGTGVAEVVEDRVSGLVVPPEDPGALEFALLRLAADASLRTDLAAGALQRAKDFAPRNSVAAVLSGYAEVLGR